MSQCAAAKTAAGNALRKTAGSHAMHAVNAMKQTRQIPNSAQQPAIPAGSAIMIPVHHVVIPAGDVKMNISAMAALMNAVNATSATRIQGLIAPHNA